MDEAPRERGDEGYGACFDDARSRLHTLWQKRPQAFFASLKQLGRRKSAPELFDFCYSPSAAVR
jgi:hypothetical protein